jgi:hypothetical protein
MKCEAVQALLSRYRREELKPKQHAEVAAHLSECTDCREALAFERSLETRLDAVGQASQSLQQRVFTQIATPLSRPALLARVLGDPTMKKILISSTAVTALVAGALLLAPRTASASTPVETLKSMRAALAQAVEDGELTLNLNSDAEGAVTVSGTLNGAPLPDDFPLVFHTTREGDILDITVTADFTPSDYKSIAYGKDNNTLEIVPKASPNKRFEIGLDPKSRQPKSWTTWTNQGGSTWKETSRTSFKTSDHRYHVVRDDTTINVRVKMHVGQTATITARSSAADIPLGKAPTG